MRTLLALAFTLIAMLSLLLYETEEAMNSERAKNAELKTSVYELEKDNEKLRDKIYELRSNDIVSEANNEANNEYTVYAELTAYNCDDGDTPGTTMANGETVHYGAVANDTVPLGSKVVIDGEEFVVKDRFGGGYGIERFDVYTSSVSDCEKFGRQYKEVKIIRK